MKILSCWIKVFRILKSKFSKNYEIIKIINFLTKQSALLFGIPQVFMLFFNFQMSIFVTE